MGPAFGVEAWRLLRVSVPLPPPQHPFFFSPPAQPGFFFFFFSFLSREGPSSLDRGSRVFGWGLRVRAMGEGTSPPRPTSIRDSWRRGLRGRRDPGESGCQGSVPVAPKDGETGGRGADGFAIRNMSAPFSPAAPSRTRASRERRGVRRGERRLYGRSAKVRIWAVRPGSDLRVCVPRVTPQRITDDQWPLRPPGSGTEVPFTSNSSDLRQEGPPLSTTVTVCLCSLLALNTLYLNAL